MNTISRPDGGAEPLDNSSGLAIGARPLRVLFVAVEPWKFPLRLARALAANGCVTAAICPKGHPLRRTSCISAVVALPALRSSEIIASSICDWNPEIVVCCDDEAALLLNKARSFASERVLGVIEKSQGPEESFRIISSKSRFLQHAKSLGILCPKELRLDEMQHGCDDSTAAYVIKKDKGFGGSGVFIVRSQQERVEAEASLGGPESAWRLVLRGVRRRSLWPVVKAFQNIDKSFTVQEFISGQPANRAVFCSNGNVIGGLTVRVIEEKYPSGPGVIVEFISHCEIESTVERIVSSLRLSGLIGFDFMIQAETKRAFLIEANARATPISYLTDKTGFSLCSAVCSYFGQPLQKCRVIGSMERVAFFPEGVALAVGNPVYGDVHLDIPWEEPWMLFEDCAGFPMLQSMVLPRMCNERD